MFFIVYTFVSNSVNYIICPFYTFIVLGSCACQRLDYEICWLSVKAPLVTMGRHKFTPTTVPSPLTITTHLIHLSLDRSHSPSQTVSRSSQPFCHNELYLICFHPTFVWRYILTKLSMNTNRLHLFPLQPITVAGRQEHSGISLICSVMILHKFLALSFGGSWWRMVDDQDTCEWMNVSSGTVSPR